MGRHGQRRRRTRRRRSRHRRGTGRRDGHGRARHAGDVEHDDGADGAYLFDNLEPGTYKLTFGTPAGSSPTAADQGGNDALDSDAGAGGMTVNGSADLR
ncbi:MAG: hypothetical protein IPN33_17365 [Saprospiraceae bacterium]|nr:hypothetical protein [Saprospiraceae bacterium]